MKRKLEKNAEEHGVDVGVVTEDNNRSEKKYFKLIPCLLKRTARLHLKIIFMNMSLQDIVTVVFWTSTTP